MSTIDKDKKAKVSAPSDSKFVLGFKDGFIFPNAAPAVFITKILRRSK